MVVAASDGLRCGYAEFRDKLNSGGGGEQLELGPSSSAAALEVVEL